MKKSGARPAGKRGGLGTKPAKKAKKSQADDDGDAFFLADEDDRKREEEEDEDEEEQETADQLRLRLGEHSMAALYDIINVAFACHYGILGSEMLPTLAAESPAF